MPSTSILQTIHFWLEAAGHHVEAVHHDLVTQPRDLAHVQADEVRVKTQCGSIWMAVMVPSRLWLDGVISTRRDQRLSERLIALVAASAIVAPLLVGVDGFARYIQAIRLAFRTRVASGRRGALRKVPWTGCVLGR